MSDFVHELAKADICGRRLVFGRSLAAIISVPTAIQRHIMIYDACRRMRYSDLYQEGRFARASYMNMMSYSYKRRSRCAPGPFGS